MTMTKRAQRVYRRNRLGEFTGLRQTQNDELVKLGLVRLFSMSPGGRAQVFTEDNIAELQEAAMQAGSLQALIARAKAAA